MKQGLNAATDASGPRAAVLGDSAASDASFLVVGVIRRGDGPDDARRSTSGRGQTIKAKVENEARAVKSATYLVHEKGEPERFPFGSPHRGHRVLRPRVLGFLVLGETSDPAFRVVIGPASS